jgi:hypothetical protein
MGRKVHTAAYFAKIEKLKPSNIYNGPMGPYYKASEYGKVS